MIKNTNVNSLKDLLNTISNILFGKDIKDIEEYLNIYGNSESLNILRLNNRNNQEISNTIDNALIITTIFEDILSINDIQVAQELIKNIITNINDVIEYTKILRNYEELMRQLYEKDIIENLSNVQNIKDYNAIVDKEMTNKIGIDVIDFSDKQYTLLAHTVSEKENIEDLTNGYSGKMQVISLTPISHRNQSYYKYFLKRVILATDEFVEGNFIQSSITNMSSNNSLKRFSTEVSSIKNRTQRGVLTSSESRGTFSQNSEILSLRSELKFKYIILPDGRQPTSEEIKLAKTHNLKFIKTQPVLSKIDSPKPIEYKNKDSVVSSNKQELIDLKELLNKIALPTETRKIGIITDCHGLYEPTLAILQDMRKNGITEIYSLGDCIGLGPNSSEVMELFKLFNVKSIKGNHELYQELGIDYFKTHFKSNSSYIEAKENVEYTSGVLTSEQLEELKKWPEDIEIEICGKKILLTHSIYDYLTQMPKYDTTKYDLVFQGHIHFAEKEGNVITVRAAGIGDLTNEHTAEYTVIDIENNGKIFNRRIKYDINNLIHGINESLLSESDKEKLNRWLKSNSIRR